jgi:hypothetical protein
MDNIGSDCWNMINTYKTDLELLDHKKKFAVTLKTIRDQTSYSPCNPISYKMLNLYLETVNIVSCSNPECDNVHKYTMIDSFMLDYDETEALGIEAEELYPIDIDEIEEEIREQEILEENEWLENEWLEDFIEYIDYGDE